MILFALCLKIYSNELNFQRAKKNLIQEETNSTEETTNSTDDGQGSGDDPDEDDSIDKPDSPYIFLNRRYRHGSFNLENASPFHPTLCPKPKNFVYLPSANFLQWQNRPPSPKNKGPFGPYPPPRRHGNGVRTRILNNYRFRPPYGKNVAYDTRAFFTISNLPLENSGFLENRAYIRSPSMFKSNDLNARSIARSFLLNYPDDIFLIPLI